MRCRNYEEEAAEEEEEEGRKRRRRGCRREGKLKEYSMDDVVVDADEAEEAEGENLHRCCCCCCCCYFLLRTRPKVPEGGTRREGFLEPRTKKRKKRMKRPILGLGMRHRSSMERTTTNSTL